MSGVKGQGRGNSSALKHGQRSLVALVQRSQDASHPAMQIIHEKARGYMLDRGGAETLSTMELDTLRHGAVLAILADLHVRRLINDQGKCRRMSGPRFKDLALGYARIVEAHGRVLGLVGLARRERELPDAFAYIRRGTTDTEAERAVDAQEAEP
jgi:hypothetical protein